jgi:hypothetical protein
VFLLRCFTTCCEYFRSHVAAAYSSMAACRGSGPVRADCVIGPLRFVPGAVNDPRRQ